MGTITTRKRDDGTFGYSAQIRLKKKGKIVHTESKTFDREQAAKAWLKKGAKIIAITRGGEGCSVFTRRFAFEVLAPKVKVADTVGAGDTFTAGLLRHLSMNGQLTKKALASIGDEDLKAAAFYAMRAAAITVSRPGADPPWAHEMQ